MIPGRLPLAAAPGVGGTDQVLHDALVRAGPETVVHRFERIVGATQRRAAGGAKTGRRHDARRSACLPTTSAATKHGVILRDCDARPAGPKTSLWLLQQSKFDERPELRETNRHTTRRCFGMRALCTRSAVMITRRTTVQRRRQNRKVPTIPPVAGVCDGVPATYETQSRLAGALREPRRLTRRLPPPEDLRGTPALRGAHAGCVEKRPQFAPNCEFDGRFSLAKLGSTYHLFARANLVGEKGARGHFGGRFVQSAASTTSPRGPFGAFSVVDVPGFRAPFARALNVYFAAVTSNPADPTSRCRAVPAQGRRTGDSGSRRLVRRKALLEARRPREHDRRRRLPHGRPPGGRSAR